MVILNIINQCMTVRRCLEKLLTTIKPLVSRAEARRVLPTGFYQQAERMNIWKTKARRLFLIWLEGVKNETGILPQNTSAAGYAHRRRREAHRRIALPVLMLWLPSRGALPAVVQVPDTAAFFGKTGIGKTDAQMAVQALARHAMDTAPKNVRKTAGGGGWCMLVLAQLPLLVFPFGSYQCDMSRLQRQQANYPNADNPQSFLTREAPYWPAVPRCPHELGEMDGGN